MHLSRWRVMLLGRNSLKLASPRVTAVICRKGWWKSSYLLAALSTSGLGKEDLEQIARSRRGRRGPRCEGRRTLIDH
jgi:hypothetical protein